MKHFLAVIMLTFLALGQMQAAAQAECLSQAEARDAVASGKAASLGSLKGAAGGEIVKAQLCVEGGRYVYRLSVLIGGQVKTVVLPAGR